jgi:hypothetical protein
VGGAKDDTAVTANTVLLVTPHLIIFRVIIMHPKGALIDTHLALDTPLRVSLNDKL